MPLWLSFFGGHWWQERRERGAGMFVFTISLSLSMFIVSPDHRSVAVTTCSPSVTSRSPILISSLIKLGPFCARHPSPPPLLFPLCCKYKLCSKVWRVRCLTVFYLCSSFDRAAAAVTKGKPGPPGGQVNKPLLSLLTASHQFSHVWQERSL